MTTETETTTTLPTSVTRLVMRVTPPAMTALQRLYFGKKLFLYGPSWAGKTSLIGYMKSGAIAKDGEEVRETLRVKTHWLMSFKLPTFNNIQVDLRALRDRPGHFPAELQSLEMIKEAPQHCIVLLDATKPFSGSSPDSISNFLFEFFNTIKLTQSRCAKIETIWIVINKADKKSISAMNGLEDKVRKACLRHATGTIHLSKVRIRSCSLIEGEKWHKIRESLLHEVLCGVIS